MSQLDRQTQLDLLLEHYQQPCCRERMPDADVTMPGGNTGCGDLVTVYLKVVLPSSVEPGLASEGSGQRVERVDRATFVGSGCTISQAAASMLMEKVEAERPSLDEILEMDHEDIVELLGRDVVSIRPRCAMLALGTLKTAVRKYRDDERRRAIGLPVEERPPGEIEPEPAD